MRKVSKLIEVARLAGVAPITASRAIRGEGYVSAEARERIMAAAARHKIFRIDRVIPEKTRTYNGFPPVRLLLPINNRLW